MPELVEGNVIYGVDMKQGWMYILECSDGSYYTGSTSNLERRISQHQTGNGANYTKKHLPVKLVYYEKFQKIAEAFYREKHGEFDKLTHLSKNYTQYPQTPFSTDFAALRAEPVEALSQPVEGNVIYEVDGEFDKLTHLSKNYTQYPQTPFSTDFAALRAEPIEALSHPVEALSHPVEALPKPVEALPKPVEALPSKRCLNLSKRCLNLSKRCLNLSKRCLNLSKRCLSLSKATLFMRLI